jgi:hypothetical protein
MTWKWIGVVLILAGAAMFSACGGGSGDGSGDAGEPTSTTAVVAFSAISTAQLPVRINGINISVNLPVGVSAPTDSSNPMQISSTALVTGSALDSIPAADKQIVGSYSSNTRLVSISVAAASGTSGFGPGEYALLNCVVAPGVTVAQSGITALTPVTFTATGYDASTHSTVDLTGYLAPRFALK